MREVFSSDRIQLEFVGTEKAYFDKSEYGLQFGRGELKAKKEIFR